MEGERNSPDIESGFDVQTYSDCLIEEVSDSVNVFRKKDINRAVSMGMKEAGGRWMGI